MKQQTLALNDDNLPRKGSLARKLLTTGMYGGDIHYRKLKRPVSKTKSMHIVFKMTNLAFRKSGGFRKETAFINKKLLLLCNKFGIHRYRHSINGNHIHVLCKMDGKHIDENRKQLAQFLRAFSGSIGLYYKLKYHVTGGLWKGRPFTRLVTWGKQYSRVCAYIAKNFKEVVGFVSYTPRHRSKVKLFSRKRTGTAKEKTAVHHQHEQTFKLLDQWAVSG